MDATPPFNVAFIVSVVGLMLFNCLYGSFALIYRIVRPEDSPDNLLAPNKVAGIEMCAASCVLFLGTLTYFHGYGGDGYEIFVLGIAVVVLLIGLYVIWLPKRIGTWHSNVSKIAGRGGGTRTRKPCGGGF